MTDQLHLTGEREAELTKEQAGLLILEEMAKQLETPAYGLTRTMVERWPSLSRSAWNDIIRSTVFWGFAHTTGNRASTMYSITLRGLAFLEENRKALAKIATYG